MFARLKLHPQHCQNKQNYIIFNNKNYIYIIIRIRFLDKNDFTVKI